MSQLPGFIGLTGVKNARELGGIPAAGGKTVRKGLLLRTGALCDATEEDRRILAQDYRLAWVADFRTLKEANARPDPAFRGASFYHLLVLDEMMSACSTGVVPEAEVLAFLQNKPEALEVVMTGRNPSQALMDQADYVTEMRKIKHPFDQGVPARLGVEF